MVKPAKYQKKKKIVTCYRKLLSKRQLCLVPVSKAGLKPLFYSLLGHRVMCWVILHSSQPSLHPFSQDRC